MSMLRKSAVVALLVLMLGVLFACSHNQAAKSVRAESGVTGPLYTAYNIWYEKPDSISCVNYQRGALIAAGTRVTDVRARGSKITFTTVNGGPYTVTFHAQFHPGLNVQAFKDRMLTSKDFEQLTAGMSPSEVECIKAGLVKAGVSKACVLVAYGYPPEHVTPSLNNNTWIFWENRFRQAAVNFNAEGQTTGVSEPVRNTRARGNR